MPGPAGKLEAMIEAHPGTPVSGVIVCHPHPQYGGDMNNNVVMAAYDWAKSAKYLAVRFNFRGVGQSEGEFNDGEGEREDVKTVVDYARREYRVKRILLVGYSFGAWVAYRYARAAGGVAALILIAPPVSVIGPWDPPAAPLRVGIIRGTDDAFCGSEVAASFASPLGARTVTLEGADHFLSGREADLVLGLDKLVLQLLSEP